MPPGQVGVSRSALHVPSQLRVVHPHARDARERLLGERQPDVVSQRPEHRDGLLGDPAQLLGGAFRLAVVADRCEHQPGPHDPPSVVGSRGCAQHRLGEGDHPGEGLAVAQVLLGELQLKLPAGRPVVVTQPVGPLEQLGREDVVRSQELLRGSGEAL